MERVYNLSFERPSFFKRLKSMLSVDFYRLFHTPLLYIFLLIAAIIPALVSMGASGGEGETSGLFTNAWQIIAAQDPLYLSGTTIRAVTSNSCLRPILKKKTI